MDVICQIRGATQTATLTGNDQVIAAYDPQRVSVVFPSFAHSVLIAFGQSTAQQSFFVAANAPPFMVDASMIGDLIHGDIHIKGTAADVVTLWLGNA